MEHKKNILIGCTGSVAAIKLPVVLNLLKKRDQSFQVSIVHASSIFPPFKLSRLQIRVVLTERAKHFVNINEISSMAEIFTDQSEWQITKGLNEQSLHLELVQWADIFIISPLDANTLGKISSGICDNLLTCVARAWDLHKPLLFCPEMNTRQFLHPITNKQIEEMKLFGYYELPSISETLLTEGSSAGALSEINYIIDAIFNHVQQLQNQAVGMSHEQKFNHGMHHAHSPIPSPLNDSKSSTSPMSSIFQQAGIGGVAQIKQKSEPMSFGEKPFTCDVCGGELQEVVPTVAQRLTLNSLQANSRATPACGRTRRCTQVKKRKRRKKVFNRRTCADPPARRSVVKNFFMKSFLYIDLKTGVKKFSCDICNASFAKANYLNNHKRTHTG